MAVVGPSTVPVTDYTALLSGNYWNGIEATGAPIVVTFSFPTSLPAYDTSVNGFSSTTPATYTGFSSAEQAQAIAALGEWAAASGIVFVEVAPGQGDINFGNVDFNTTSYSGAGGIGFYPFGDWNSYSYPYYSGDLTTSGDVFMNSQFQSADGSVNYGTLLHEIGHAIGLKHPTEVVTDYAADPAVIHNQVLASGDDPTQTIMATVGDSGTSDAHLLQLDKDAAAFLYGAAGTGGVYTDSASGTNSVSSWSFDASTQTLTQTATTVGDVIHGTSVNDVIYGSSGDDQLFGLAGNDQLYGGAGNDKLYGGSGNDLLVGGAGDDSYYISSPTDTIVEAPDEGYDVVYSTVSYKLPNNVEALYLSGQGLTGTANNAGGSIFGDGTYSSRLIGGAGSDYLVGGAGADVIQGGAGPDLMYGGGGADTFVFTSLADAPVGPNLTTIGDFVSGQDKLDLSAIKTEGLSPGQDLQFIGTAAFSGHAGEVHQIQSGSNTILEGDVNGDGVADFQIQLDGSVTLQQSDLILAPTANVVANFNSIDGASPFSGLISDAAGNLFGATAGGGSGDGTVFEIARTSDGYGSSTTLVAFDGTNGSQPFGRLVADSDGNLFGTTQYGGANGYGEVFEIAKTGDSYSSTPIVLASFDFATDTETTVNGLNPVGGLIVDASGNLFGTTTGGGWTDGNVFEIPKMAGAYGSLTVLASFSGLNGSSPHGALLADSSGNLFGTTYVGGAYGDGEVFEIARSGAGYNSTPVVLVSFGSPTDTSDGANPASTLISDSAGNLYGTTAAGGAFGKGEIFEIVKAGNTYDSAPVVLASFNGTDGAGPQSGLLMDAAGNLFGATTAGGANGQGVVYELAKTPDGYDATPTVIESFDVANGAQSYSDLLANLAGDLLGTTAYGGTNSDGVVFDIGGSNFQTVACYCPGTRITTTTGDRPVERLSIGDEILTINGEVRPIKWIGRRSYGGHFILGRLDIMPVCFKAGSLGDGLPRRDLWISPHHAMLLDGVLIEAKDLINGASIVQASDIDRVDYIHIELEGHDVIFAEGAPSESFVDDDSRNMFHNAHEYRTLYGDHEPIPAKYCAPRLDSGFAVDAVRRRLARLAKGKNTDDPKLGARNVRGRIDLVETGLVEGWAQDTEYPEAPVCLDVYFEDNLIGQALANGYRNDLREAGLGSGQHSFRFKAPTGINLLEGRVEIRRSSDGVTLSIVGALAQAS